MFRNGTVLHHNSFHQVIAMSSPIFPNCGSHRRSAASSALRCVPAAVAEEPIRPPSGDQHLPSPSLGLCRSKDSQPDASNTYRMHTGDSGSTRTGKHNVRWSSDTRSDYCTYRSLTPSTGHNSTSAASPARVVVSALRPASEMRHILTCHGHRTLSSRQYITAQSCTTANSCEKAATGRAEFEIELAPWPNTSSHTRTWRHRAVRRREAGDAT